MAGDITIEGIGNVLRALERYRVAINHEARQGMRKAGMGVVADAQRNLRQNTSWVTGLLANSGRVIDAKDDEGGVDAGFFDQSNSASGYAMYVEFGRKAGRMPPPSALEEWFYKKHRVRDRKAARAMGWGAAVNIARRGTQPHPFFYPAIQKWSARINRVVSDAIKKVISK